MDAKIRDGKRTRLLLREIGRPGGKSANVAIVLPMLSGLLLVAQAYGLAEILHRAIVGGASIEDLRTPILLLAGVLVFRAVLSFAGDRAAMRASERIKTGLRGEIFGKLMADTVGDHDTRASGALAATMIEQVDQLEGYYAGFRPAAIQAACLPLAFGIAVFKVDIVVALLFIITAPLIPLFMALAGWGAEAAMRDQAQALTRLSGHFADRLRGIVTLKLFGRAESETLAVHQAGEALRRRTLGVLKIAFLSSAILEFFAALGVAGVALYVGLTYLGFLHMAQGLSLRSGLFCLLMAPEVYQPLRLLSAHYHDKKSAESALDEIEAQVGTLEAMLVPSISLTLPTPVHTFATGGSVSLLVRNLSLATSDKRTILREVDMSLSGGEHAVLIGESGVGKSSLLHAIARLRSFEGEILIGGQPAGTIAEFELRRQVCILNQKPFLFRGSIADNLRLANAGATDADLVRVGEMACLFHDISERPLRLDTLIGDGGSGISGGQAQRLSLARIFLRDAGLLLLDEPTAHLDAATEALILDALADFAAGRTMLIATHSSAVIDRFRRVFRITSGGKITEASNARLSYPQADAA